MELKILRSLWGLADGTPGSRFNSPIEAVVDTAASTRWDGIEAPLHVVTELADRPELWSDHGLVFVAIVQTDGENVHEHLATLRTRIAQAAVHRPRHITCHAGLSSFSHDDTHRFMTEALQLQNDIGIDFAFESHRGRIMETPWRAQELCATYSDLHLCADFGHWVVGSASLLQHASDVLGALAERCIHIHARVATEEHSQVVDPRSPAHDEHLLAHQRWWTNIWRAQQQRASPDATMLVEYGPPPYQSTDVDGRPIGQLEEICDWTADTERARFEDLVF